MSTFIFFTHCVALCSWSCTLCSLRRHAAPSYSNKVLLSSVTTAFTVTFLHCAPMELHPLSHLYSLFSKAPACVLPHSAVTKTVLLHPPKSPTWMPDTSGVSGPCIPETKYLHYRSTADRWHTSKPEQARSKFAVETMVITAGRGSS